MEGKGRMRNSHFIQSKNLWRSKIYLFCHFVEHFSNGLVLKYTSTAWIFPKIFICCSRVTNINLELPQCHVDKVTHKPAQ